MIPVQIPWEKKILIFVLPFNLNFMSKTGNFPRYRKRSGRRKILFSWDIFIIIKTNLTLMHSLTYQRNGERNTETMVKGDMSFSFSFLT